MSNEDHYPIEMKAAIENLKDGIDYLVVYIKDDKLYWRSKYSYSVTGIMNEVAEDVKFYGDLIRAGVLRGEDTGEDFDDEV